MNFAKWFIVVVASLLGLFILATFFLPTDYYVERSVEINAPAIAVYPQVADLEVWQEWNPWNELDPEMTIEYGEITVGKGAFYSWKSDVAGSGKMTITDAEAPSMVSYELVFEGYENAPSFSKMLLATEDPLGPTTVTWTFEGSVGDKFFARWMAFLMDKFVGTSYEQGLQALKERCESVARES